MRVLVKILTTAGTAFLTSGAKDSMICVWLCGTASVAIAGAPVIISRPIRREGANLRGFTVILHTGSGLLHYLLLNAHIRLIFKQQAGEWKVLR
jgi:hypothetical protein